MSTTAEQSRGLTIATDEAARLMTICNACRYCEGHCAVFPAMERRVSFEPRVIEYLANLCHQCGACYHHCQYADPHEFNVNVPRALQQARHASYRSNAWPAFMARVFDRPLAFSLYSWLIAVALFVGAVAAVSGPQALFSPTGGSFYAVIPHPVMAGIFGALGLMVVLVWVLSARNFWIRLGLPPVSTLPRAVWWQGVRAALTLKNLDGGHGRGCYLPTEAPSLARRRFHHLTMYGFLACFAATCTGAVYHWLLDMPAPYGWLSLPGLLGSGGGIAMLVGIPGLCFTGGATRRAEIPVGHNGLGQGLMLLLFLTVLTGFAVPLQARGDYQGLALCLHLGTVAALFLNFAWGKFIHWLYRLIALIADTHEAHLESSTGFTTLAQR